MSFSIESWMKHYQKQVGKEFGNRIWFIGLQGSYGRGEATEKSDIDVVFILDHMSIEDLQRYSAVLDTLPNRDKICGFAAGKEELLSWEPSDLFQFYYDTTPIVGSLDTLLENIQRDDVLHAIRIGACNIYHMGVHNLIHEKNTDILKGLYKSAVFTLQAIAFYQTGQYEKNLEWTQPVNLQTGQDSTVIAIGDQQQQQQILENYTFLKQRKMICKEELVSLSNILLQWASKWIKRCNGNL